MDNPGYLSREYAESFDSLASAIELPAAKGWLLGRTIPGTQGLQDAMGCYPIFCCRNWNNLSADLDGLSARLISLAIVTDPFADVDREFLEKMFERVKPYKQNFIVVTDQAPESFVNKSHQRHAKRALKDVSVELCETPLEWINDWVDLYSQLVLRHGISGLRRFTRSALERQLTIPGLKMFRSSIGGRTVGLDLWYVQGDVAHGHLVAFSEEGYAHRAAYASKWFVLDYFKSRVGMLNLGAGHLQDASDGLSYFKQGFANATLPSWLCGRIFQPDQYARLCSQVGVNRESPHAGYFPAYRAGEFTNHSGD